MATRSVSNALKWALSAKVGYGGYCLKFVRTAYNIDARFRSASAAWRGAKYRHTDLSKAPRGAFIFLTRPGSEFGHVAIITEDGGQKMRTTNSATNKIHTDLVSTWVSWGYTVLGWSEDINGVRVAGLKPLEPSKPKKSTVILKRGSKGAKVRALQAGLRTHFPAYRQSVKVRRGELISVDGDYGPQTEAWVQVFQARVGLKTTGKVNKATRAALKRHNINI